MSKVIAKEVNPSNVDFEYYFDDEGLTNAGGENCAVYIPATQHSRGFNADEYKRIQDQAEAILEGFDDVSNKWTNGYNSYTTYKEVMQFNDIDYSSHKCHLLKEWAKNADISDSDDIARFLTITTGEEWNTKAFCGYSQGDYCEVVYCEKHYTEEHLTEIGKFWLGCGTEFVIDGCGGYYVIDTIRWDEGQKLINYLAGLSGYKPEELEVHLFSGEHVVSDYKVLTA